MAMFQVHLMGQHHPITHDLPARNIDDLVEQTGGTRFLVGHLVDADEEGVCRRVMIATGRIQCAVEAN